jgi:hypothetical protein
MATIKTSLLDIGPLTEELKVRGHPITVNGITAAQVFELFMKYPEVRKLLDGSARANLNVAEMLHTTTPNVIGAVIAMATGDAGKAEAEEKAKQLGVGDQLAIITATLRLTFPDGFGPFVEQVMQMTNRVNEAVSAGTSAMATAPGSGKVLDTSSLKRSSAAFQTDTPGMMPGTRHRAN